MKIPEITHLNRLNNVFFKSLLGSEERKALTLNFINSILDRDENNAFIDLIFADKEEYHSGFMVNSLYWMY